MLSTCPFRPQKPGSLPIRKPLSSLPVLILFDGVGYTEWTSNINTHNIVGWYHSHPSYGCWLSGIDVETTKWFQEMNDPFISVVIDPIKSLNFRNFYI